MGMAGAAYATIIGQIISALLVIRYMCHFKTVPLHLSELKPKADYIMHIVLLGTSPFINQIAMMIVQVVMNNDMEPDSVFRVRDDANTLSIEPLPYSLED